ncbi:MAG TPA: hypothetical protein VHU22_14385 [Xanthobacteraceae bacterium]|jgi:hypothetical protein|nr:hypothetical protein [Xanthobacteraceae bacterium]
MHAPQVASLLDPYVGQPVTAVTSRFGEPSDQFASSAAETTFEWNNFGAGQSGMNGCRVLVVALRTGRDTSVAVPFNGSALVNPSENSTAWIIKSWSSFGSGCR